MNEDRSRIWAGTLLTNFLIVLCGIVSGVLTARLLQPEGRGMLASIIFWPQIFATVGLMSLNEAITLRLSRDTTRGAAILTSVFFLGAVLAVISVGAAYVAMDILLAGKQQDVVQIAQRYLVIFIPMHFLAMVLLAVDHGRLEFHSYNMLRLIPGVIFLLALSVLWITDRFTLVNCAWANLWSIVGTTAVIVFRRRSWSVSFRINSETWKLLRSGLQIHAHAILLMLSSQADRAFVLAIFEPRLAGIYIVAWTLPATVSSLLGSTVHSVFLPFSARLDQRSSHRALLRKAIQQTVLASTATFCALALCLPWLVYLLFGREYTGAIGLGIMLCAASALSVVRQALISALRGLGSYRPAIVAEVVSLLTFVSTGAMAYRSLGIMGIALGLVVGYLAGTFALAICIKTEYEVTAADWNGFTLSNIALSWSRIKELIARE